MSLQGHTVLATGHHRAGIRWIATQPADPHAPVVITDLDDLASELGQVSQARWQQHGSTAAAAEIDMWIDTTQRLQARHRGRQP